VGEQSGVFYNLISGISWQKEQTLNYFPDYQKVEIIWFKTVSVYQKVTRKKSVWIERKKQNFGLGFIPETGMRANGPHIAWVRVAAVFQGHPLTLKTNIYKTSQIAKTPAFRLMCC